MDRRQWLTGGAALALSPLIVPQSARAAIDFDAIDRIKTEGLRAKSSKVMETASYLTDVLGPRLSGSPAAQTSGEWVVKRMREWGFDGAMLEPWPADTSGQNNGFPRGWSNEKFYLHATMPLKFPITGMSVGWTPGTNGLVEGDCALVIETDERELKSRWAGKLKGKWVLTQAPRDIPAQWAPVARRYTDDELERLEAPLRPPVPAAARPARTPGAAAPVVTTFNRDVFFREQGVLGLISTNKGQGVITVLGASRSADPATVLPQITIIAEHYGRIARSLQKDVAVAIEADIRNVFHPNPPMFNVVGELRGKDKPDEVVIVGGHFDSFHAATGATDNAGPCAAALEALRLLKTTGAHLSRTVRVCLWTGEEQGLIGSRLYVREHFGGASGLAAKPAHAGFQAYFNLDNGGGAIRGVYAQNNPAIAAIFRTWLEPFRDIGAAYVSPRGVGGTDHQSFDAANLPGFQFIQDPIDYDSKTHHTNLDFYESLQPEDLRRNATILAGLCFLASNHSERLPRKQPAPPAQRRP